MVSAAQHPTEVLPEIVWSNTSRFLGLKDLSSLASSHPYLNALINSPSVINSCLSVEDIAIANDNFYEKYSAIIKAKITPDIMSRVNCKFLKKYFQFLTVEHIQAINYGLMTRQVLKSITTEHESPVFQTALFLYSHEAMRQIANEIIVINDAEEKMSNEIKALWNAQQSYLHLVIWGGWDRKLMKYDKMALPLHSLEGMPQNQVQYLLRMEALAWRVDICSSVRERRLCDMSDARQSTGHLWHMDLYRLAIHNPDLLENASTKIWTQFNTVHLDCMSTLANRVGNMYSYMPIWIFRGFCNALVAKKINDFGRFKFWYMTDDHLRAWNAAFKNTRKIEWIKVCFFNDVKPDTLKEFIAIINKLDPASIVEADMIDTELSYPYADETRRIFEAHQAQIEVRNPRSRWGNPTLE